ncbi:hypothetical protein HX017_05440 [Myroides marinus]|uniref:hypothetical protein n=1 Tax=Myroides marinus TaxID=703342 RepID=UPI000741B793|nr:hypothetical protein [Myroides marinus]KUF43317.1 hypothetical protein AS361_10365 [Myroides marinus]MDM1348783.1 hypothetical protein [Myroides marinus]MDM1349610.1 hypothetical protein [Myroides marinus]MDM1356819.1 hypothetical protein [Myroides marinus]MDM1361865.1 hypothetical protein [Myroides marinus]
MQILLWALASIVFVGSIFMFIPSVMSIASPRSKVEGRRYYWIDKVSKIFFGLVMLYPVVFLIAVLCYKFLDWEVIHGLLGYVMVLLVLFLTWSILDKSKK